MAKEGHPKGLYLLFVTEMAERFSYYLSLCGFRPAASYRFIRFFGVFRGVLRRDFLYIRSRELVRLAFGIRVGLR